MAGVGIFQAYGGTVSAPRRAIDALLGLHQQSTGRELSVAVTQGIRRGLEGATMARFV
jgi:hypothetical protein